MRRLRTKFQGRLRSIATTVVIEAFVVAAIVLALASVRMRAARAADAPQIVVKIAGKLPVPPAAALGVIATDPVLQQVLSQDFQLAGRLADASTRSETTLTVTLTHRALEPGMSLNSVAPGNGEAVALLKQAGVKPPPLPEQTAQDRDENSDADDVTAAEGNPDTSNDVNTYQHQGQMQQQPAPLGGPMGFPMTQWPVPPAIAQDRSAIPPDMQTYQNSSPREDARHQREASAVYDTIFVVRATAGTDSGGLTVVAVAHPGFDPHEVRKLIAEEIANSILH